MGNSVCLFCGEPGALLIPLGVRVRIRRRSRRVASDLSPSAGFSLHWGQWHRPPPEGHKASSICLLPQLCDWTPLTVQITQVRHSYRWWVSAHIISYALLQMGIMLPAVVHHVRLMKSLIEFEKCLPQPFSDKSLLARVNLSQCKDSELASLIDGVFQAITHSSYAGFVNEGGICHVISRITSRVGQREHGQTLRAERTEKGIPSAIQYFPIESNQTLEYLGDAVLEFICSIRLFSQVISPLRLCWPRRPHNLSPQLPDHDEGSLTRFRSGLVNNAFIAHLARTWHIDDLVLHAAVPELTDHLSLPRRNMLADAWEAFLGMTLVVLRGGITHDVYL